MEIQLIRECILPRLGSNFTLGTDAFRQEEPKEVLCRNYARSIFDSHYHDFHNKLGSNALLNFYARSTIFRKNQHRIPIFDGAEPKRELNSGRNFLELFQCRHGIDYSIHLLENNKGLDFLDCLKLHRMHNISCCVYVLARVT